MADLESRDTKNGISKCRNDPLALLENARE